jgi:Glycosyltransferase family 10 (fucosyltransferase) C-term
VLYKKAFERNIVLATDDMLPVQGADIVLCMLQPNSPHEFVPLKQKYPHLKTIMVLLETSLGAEWARRNRRNHIQFDAILTYDGRLVDNKRYFPMRTRAFFRGRITTGLPFGERRVGCLVGTNRRTRFRSGIMAMRKGWNFSWHDWYDYAFVPEELITYRSTVGRLCAQYPPGTFDIFGEGWDLHEETRDRCLGIPKASTLSYIGNYRYYFAFENHEGENSLISERIWDALWGDTVPVYRGNKNLRRIIPKECFLDANEFESPKAMLDWLVRSSESEWVKCRKAGRDFIQSPAVEKFLPEACAEEMLRPIVALAEQVRSLQADKVGI